MCFFPPLKVPISASNCWTICFFPSWCRRVAGQDLCFGNGVGDFQATLGGAFVRESMVGKVFCFWGGWKAWKRRVDNIFWIYPPHRLPVAFLGCHYMFSRESQPNLYLLPLLCGGVDGNYIVPWVGPLPRWLVTTRICVSMFWIGRSQPKPSRSTSGRGEQPEL